MTAPFVRPRWQRPLLLLRAAPARGRAASTSTGASRSGHPRTLSGSPPRTGRAGLVRGRLWRLRSVRQGLEQRARIVLPGYTVNPACNYYFMVVSTFLIAWLYERHMDNKVDPLAAEIRQAVAEDVESYTRRIGRPPGLELGGLREHLREQVRFRERLGRDHHRPLIRLRIHRVHAELAVANRTELALRLRDRELA